MHGRKCYLALCLRLVAAITNYERGDNPGSTIITVCEQFYDTLVGNAVFDQSGWVTEGTNDEQMGKIKIKIRKIDILASGNGRNWGKNRQSEEINGEVWPNFRSTVPCESRNPIDRVYCLSR
jgi:hypothetical protein